MFKLQKTCEASRNYDDTQKLEDIRKPPPSLIEYYKNSLLYTKYL